MSKELTPWLEKQFPEIDFTFVIGHNSMDYYTDLNDRGALPDIITCRRFSLNDAAHLSDYLMDLSGTDVVGSYYDSYIENNREPSGVIRSFSDKKKARIAIIAMTANTFEENKQNAYRAGMNGHIAKPIKVKELMTMLASLLS